MVKKLMVILLLSIGLTNCASYKPVIDSKGRSGTYQESRSDEITDDMQHCSKLAKENSSWLSNTRWYFRQEETKYQVLYKKCMSGRGHSVVY